MANFKARKVVASLPSTLDADTLYAVRVGAGFDLYITDSTGLVAHRVNTEQTFEYVNKNLSSANASLTYEDSRLASVQYASGVVKTLSYEDGRLIGVTLSGATPYGISLTKTLAYEGGRLAGISYA